jgi:RNA polymerase sigma factor (sigma-70 family)
MMEYSDEHIITEILKGDKEKYALIMRKYNQRLYRIAKGYLKDEAEIEDCMQEAYIKGFTNLAKFEKRSQFATWITRILINECLHRIKKNKRMTLLDDENNIETMNHSDKLTPETESLNKELKTHLESNIAKLPEKYRVIFLMREVEKMNVGETSRILDITETNVKARLSRAKEMLRTSLMNTYLMDQVYEFNLVRCDRLAAYVMAHI